MLLTWANPATPNKMCSEMYENIPPLPCILCVAQAGKVRWEESAALEQDWTLPSSPFDSWIPQAMLSFCAQPQGGVAESMIEPWIFALQERRDHCGRWVRTWNPCVSPPLIRPDGHLLPKGEGFSPLFERVDSATPGRDALRAEWHSGKDENSFLGVCNLMQFYECMLLTCSNPATPKMMWSEMFENILPQPCIPCGAKAGNLRWTESV